MWNYFYTLSYIYMVTKNRYVFFTFDGKLILYDYESLPLASNTRYPYVRPRLLASNSSLYTTRNFDIEKNLLWRKKRSMLARHKTLVFLSSGNFTLFVRRQMVFSLTELTDLNVLTTSFFVVALLELRKND